MRITVEKCCKIVSLLGLMVATGCGSPTASELGGPSPVNEDAWRISGRLTSSDYSNGEIVALGMDGTRYRTAIAEDNSFGIELPGNSTYAVYFLPQSGIGKDDVVSASEFINGAVGTDTNQDHWAVLNFEDSAEIGLRDTLRLPSAIFNHTLDFGEVDIKGNKAFPTINPASRLDFDGDGINDSADLDDQNDGLHDADQRLESERVDICHFTSSGKGSTHNISFSELFSHLNRGDIVGQCKNTQRPSSKNDDEDNAAKAPEAPIPTANLPAAPEAKTNQPIGRDPLVNTPVVVEETPDEEADKDKAEGEEGDEDKDKDDKKDDADKNGDDKKEDGEKDGDKNADKDKDGKKKHKKRKDKKVKEPSLY